MSMYYVLRLISPFPRLVLVVEMFLTLHSLHEEMYFLILCMRDVGKLGSWDGPTLYNMLILMIPIIIEWCLVRLFAQGPDYYFTPRKWNEQKRKTTIGLQAIMNEGNGMECIYA